jgi:hypothetical protein
MLKNIIDILKKETLQQDRLSQMFKKRESFMHLLRQKFPASYPVEWPVDLSNKDAQANVRDIALKGVEEMFEALQHLKNWKTHRETEVPEVDRGEFLEEVVDSFNYFFSLLILAGFNENDFFEMFEKKDNIIRERLSGKY